MSKSNAEYLHDSYHNQRAFLYAWLGGKCVRCGTTENLEIDHIDWRLKEKNMGRLWPAKRRAEMMLELAKCQLLCYEHHKEKTAQDLRERQLGSFTHGTVYGWMKAKCVCEVCYSAKRRWHEARNESRRAGRVTRG